MNYIELIKFFWRCNEEQSFSTTEIALYFYLLEICNICRWKNPFKRNNIKIQADLSISYNTLKNARNKLYQCGLISFKSQNGSPNVTYTLSNFDEVVNEVGVRVSHEVNGEVLPSKEKLNKNKTKRDIPSEYYLEKGGKNGSARENLERKLHSAIANTSR